MGAREDSSTEATHWGEASSLDSEPTSDSRSDAESFGNDIDDNIDEDEESFSGGTTDGETSYEEEKDDDDMEFSYKEEDDVDHPLEIQNEPSQETPKMKWMNVQKTQMYDAKLWESMWKDRLDAARQLLNDAKAYSEDAAIEGRIEDKTEDRILEEAAEEEDVDLSEIEELSTRCLEVLEASMKKGTKSLQGSGVASRESIHSEVEECLTTARSLKVSLKASQKDLEAIKIDIHNDSERQATVLKQKQKKVKKAEKEKNKAISAVEIVVKETDEYVGRPRRMDNEGRLTVVVEDLNRVEESLFLLQDALSDALGAHFKAQGAMAYALSSTKKDKGNAALLQSRAQSHLEKAIEETALEMQSTAADLDKLSGRLMLGRVLQHWSHRSLFQGWIQLRAALLESDRRLQSFDKAVDMLLKSSPRRAVKLWRLNSARLYEDKTCLSDAITHWCHTLMMYAWNKWYDKLQFDDASLISFELSLGHWRHGYLTMALRAWRDCGRDYLRSILVERWLSRTTTGVVCAFMKHWRLMADDRRELGHMLSMVRESWVYLKYSQYFRRWHLKNQAGNIEGKNLSLAIGIKSVVSVHGTIKKWRRATERERTVYNLQV